MKPADRLIAQLGYKAWPHPLIASLDRHEMFFDRTSRLQRLFACFPVRPVIGLLSARHRLGIGSASAWLRLGQGLQLAWHRFGIGSGTLRSRHRPGIAIGTSSASSQHRLDIASASAWPRLSVMLWLGTGLAASTASSDLGIGSGSVSDRYRLDFGSASARHRLGIGSASLLLDSRRWTSGGSTLDALHA